MLHHPDKGGDGKRFVAVRFEAFATELKLITWKTARRVVIVRRRLGKDRAQTPGNTLPHQFSLVEPAEDLSAFEYSVLVVGAD